MHLTVQYSCQRTVNNHTGQLLGLGIVPVFPAHLRADGEQSLNRFRYLLIEAMASEIGDDVGQLLTTNRFVFVC